MLEVPGASAAGVVALPSKVFLNLVAAGSPVAAPLAWQAMARGLSGFAYRMELSPLVFAGAGAAALLAAAATAGRQAFRAAGTIASEKSGNGAPENSAPQASCLPDSAKPT